MWTRWQIVILLAAPTRVRCLYGFCNDKDLSCSSWSADGLCDTDAQVKNLCPHSCGVCHIVCSDRHDDCHRWAVNGECESSPEYMLAECATSCGLCSPKCTDLHDDCVVWAKDGQCRSNPDFMNMHCPVACGVCHSACKDTHNDCPGWAKRGECVSNPGHILKTCPNSCNLETCKADRPCSDTNSTMCAIWALADECLKNPVMMLSECPASCGVCSTVCEDKNKDCKTWALEECDENPEFETAVSAIVRRVPRTGRLVQGEGAPRQRRVVIRARFVAASATSQPTK